MTTSIDATHYGPGVLNTPGLWFKQEAARAKRFWGDQAKRERQERQQALQDLAAFLGIPRLG